MAKRSKKPKEHKRSPDYEQFEANLRFIEDQIEAAQQSQQRREVARLKLKMLILKLRYGASQLEKVEADQKPKKRKRKAS